MKKFTAYLVLALIIAVAAALLAGCTSYSPARIGSERDIDLETVNEWFHLHFKDDATIVDRSLTTYRYGDGEDESQQIIAVVIEYPAEKNEAYDKIISASYRPATNTGGELETYTYALKSHFPSAPDAFDAVYQRYDILTEEKKSLFCGEETQIRTQAYAGIVYGDSLTTVYLYTTGY